jgi:hypothetical protein
MLPLYEDAWFIFRFVEAGRRVITFKIAPGTGERLGLLAKATVGEGGWVDLQEPINMRAGDAFIAVPGQSSAIVLRQVRRFDAPMSCMDRQPWK